MRNATAQDLIRTAARAAGQLLAALAMLAFIAIRALAQHLSHHEHELSPAPSTASRAPYRHVGGRRVLGRSYDPATGRYDDEEAF
jgi:hypothetical protein